MLSGIRRLTHFGAQFTKRPLIVYANPITQQKLFFHPSSQIFASKLVQEHEKLVAELGRKVAHQFVKDPPTQFIAEHYNQPKQKKKKEDIKREPTRITARMLPKPTAKERESWPTCTAKMMNQKGSPYKLNRVAKLIRGLSAREALSQLEFNSHIRLARPVYKLVRQAMFNAENNHNMNADRLVIKEAVVMKGKYLKRIKLHGRGRAGRMLRRRVSLRLVLQEVPELENERKLGRQGWRNETWEKLQQMQEEKESSYV